MRYGPNTEEVEDFLSTTRSGRQPPRVCPAGARHAQPLPMTFPNTRVAQYLAITLDARSLEIRPCCLPSSWAWGP